MRQLYMLDGPEIEFSLEPMWRHRSDDGGPERLRGALTFLDPAVGGSGFLERAAHELQLVATHTLEHLEHKECDSACYRCLKSYANQRHHQHLDWPSIVPELEQLATATPTVTHEEDYDPRPWLESYAAGVGSPLELRFLRIFEINGLPVDKQVPIEVAPGGKPITVADFVVKGQRRAIYVDGAAFHRGERLRRDRRIRQQLQEASPGWEVITLTARDLAPGSEALSALLGPSYELPPEDRKPESKPARGAPRAAEPAQGNEPPSEPPAAQAELPDYELLEELGGGGMAECFRARDRATGTIVFLKRVQVDSHDLPALQRESDIYARLQYLDCEHLLQVRDLKRTEEHVALVTDFAEGGDLRHYVDSQPHKRLSPAVAAPIALQIARGLAALHQAEIVHRDLKPENVLLAGSSWKLADFGIAKNRAHAAPGYTFQQAGTYGYAAPEQFEGTAADPSADVYSFGKVLVFMLTGKTDLDGIPVEYADLRRLAFKCASLIPSSRPRMADVLELLGAMTGQ